MTERAPETFVGEHLITDAIIEAERIVIELNALEKQMKQGADYTGILQLCIIPTLKAAECRIPRF